MNSHELAQRRQHYHTLVKERFSAEDIACAGLALGEESLAAEALRKMDPASFKSDRSSQMDENRKREQERYLRARFNQGTAAADLLLCMRAKGEGVFAEEVMQALETERAAPEEKALPSKKEAHASKRQDDRSAQPPRKKAKKSHA